MDQVHPTQAHIDIDEKSHPAYKIGLLTQVSKDHGVSPQKVLKGTGLLESDLGNLETHTSYQQLFTVVENILEYSPSSAIALNAGQKIIPSHYGIFGYALMSHNDLESALRFSIKYHQITMRFFEHTLSCEDGLCYFQMHPLMSIPDPKIFRFICEFQLSLIFTILKDITGKQYELVKLQTTLERTDHAHIYKEIFNCDIEFGSERNALVINEELLSAPLTNRNAITAQMCDELCDKSMDKISIKQSLVADVHSLIIRNPIEQANILEAASHFHMTPRTLHRKLKSHGTTYTSILNVVRKSLAIEYLNETNFSCDTIASLLGYSDPSNFRRAFKQWTKRSPNEFRSSI